MAKLNMSSLLGLLPVVGPVIAAAPQFKKIYDELSAAFDSDADQETLKQAYAAAVSDSAHAHTQLQDIVRRHS